jgi:Zn-dependent peptidase ImmA (M78 family)
LHIKNIVETDLGDMGAMLLRYNDSYLIKVNVNHLKSRQNFSLAHEIGHILFDELGETSSLEPIEFRSFDPQGQRIANVRAKERLCDRVATELLMPENIYSKYLTNLGISINTLEKLSNLFKVSLQTSAIRAAEVSNNSCIVMIWKMNQFTKSINLAWQTGAKVTKTKKDWYIPVHKKVDFPSSLHTAFQKVDVVTCFKKFQTNEGEKRISMECKGFGRGEYRFVLSLAFPNK